MHILRASYLGCRFHRSGHLAAQLEPTRTAWRPARVDRRYNRSGMQRRAFIAGICTALSLQDGNLRCPLAFWWFSLLENRAGTAPSDAGAPSGEVDVHAVHEVDMNACCHPGVLVYAVRDVATRAHAMFVPSIFKRGGQKKELYNVSSEAQDVGELNKKLDELQGLWAAPRAGCVASRQLHQAPARHVTCRASQARLICSDMET
jgi:hypothetical protein